VSLPSVSGIAVKDAVRHRLVATRGGDEEGLNKLLADLDETSCLWLADLTCALLSNADPLPLPGSHCRLHTDKPTYTLDQSIVYLCD